MVRKNSLSDDGKPSVTVAVRIRPENERELASNAYRVLKVLDEHVILFDPAGDKTDSIQKNNHRGIPRHSSRKRDQRYAFDRVFDGFATQQEVYEYTTKGLIPFVLDGYNATVFAYGATGSGKTHTMIGNAETGPGVMVLTMRDLFETIELRKEESLIEVSISYLEVYNETIRDLFVENSPPLMLCEDGDKAVRVHDLSVKRPKSAEEVFEWLAKGNLNRRQSPTDANQESSRSHAVLQIYIQHKDRTADVTASVKMGKLSLIDLAGSERAAVSKNRGDRFKEGANINKSLLALGNCINSLGENYRQGKYVPYRNSKLTRLLKDSLGGNCRTVMIAAASPSSLCFEDTLNTLKYANRAKNIKTTVTRNVVNVKYHVSRYKQIINELRTEVEELKSKLRKNKYDTSGSGPNDSERYQSEINALKSQNRELSEKIRSMELFKSLAIKQQKYLEDNDMAPPSFRKLYQSAMSNNASKGTPSPNSKNPRKSPHRTSPRYRSLTLSRKNNAKLIYSPKKPERNPSNPKSILKKKAHTLSSHTVRNSKSELRKSVEFKSSPIVDYIRTPLGNTSPYRPSPMKMKSPIRSWKKVASPLKTNFDKENIETAHIGPSRVPIQAQDSLLNMNCQ